MHLKSSALRHCFEALKLLPVEGRCQHRTIACLCPYVCLSLRTHDVAEGKDDRKRQKRDTLRARSWRGAEATCGEGDCRDRLGPEDTAHSRRSPPGRLEHIRHLCSLNQEPACEEGRPRLYPESLRAVKLHSCPSQQAVTSSLRQEDTSACIFLLRN